MKQFAANWKLFKSPSETRRFFQEFKPLAEKSKGQLLFFPPASSWEAASQELKGTSIKWGAQNVWTQAQGAFTGENSAAILKELGGTHALVGHSERRALFGEVDSLLAQKNAYLQSLDLTPVFCIGETLEQRERGSTLKILENQLQIGLEKADRNKPVVIAYEPVWAIGTGKVATVDQVRETHGDVHKMLRSMGFASAPILYGGSVKPDNASGLISLPHVDGFLVGGASLEPSSFSAIASA